MYTIYNLQTMMLLSSSIILFSFQFDVSKEFKWTKDTYVSKKIVNLFRLNEGKMEKNSDLIK